MYRFTATRKQRLRFMGFSRDPVRLSCRTMYRNGIIRGGPYSDPHSSFADAAADPARIGVEARFTSALVLILRLEETRSTRDNRGWNGGHFNNATPAIITNRASPYRSSQSRTANDLRRWPDRIEGSGRLSDFTTASRPYCHGSF